MKIDVAKSKVVLGTLAGLCVLVPSTFAPVVASVEGRKNTALALGAAAVYEYLKGHHTNAIVLGAGTAAAAKAYEDARRHRSQQNGRYYHNYNTQPNQNYYNQGYNNGRPNGPGEKRGWRGHNMPPGQWKKHNDDGDRRGGHHGDEHHGRGKDHEDNDD